MKEGVEIQFDAEDLVRAVEGVRDRVLGRPGGEKITLRTSDVRLPEPAPEITPQEIAAARKALNLSQPVFARLLNVPTVTAASCEKGRRRPSGAALRLLQVLRKHPEVLLES